MKEKLNLLPIVHFNQSYYFYVSCLKFYLNIKELRELNFF